MHLHALKLIQPKLIRLAARVKGFIRAESHFERRLNHARDTNRCVAGIFLDDYILEMGLKRDEARELRKLELVALNDALLAYHLYTGQVYSIDGYLFRVSMPGNPASLIGPAFRTVEDDDEGESKEDWVRDRNGEYLDGVAFEGRL